MNRLQEIEARLAEIASDIETRGAAVTAEQIAAYNTEVDALKAERTGLINTAEQRTRLLNDIAEGRAQGATITPVMPSPYTNGTNLHGGGNPQGGERRTVTDPHDTREYRNAFMNYVCRNTPMPEEFRAGEYTTTEDAGAVIPTSTLQEIIRQLDSYGAIYAKVRKLNIQGGVRVPILTLKPKAKWVGEGSSDDQKIAANDYVEFSYMGLECKISQTLLAGVVTYEMFQREFVKLSVEAIVEELERSIFTGNGNGAALGIINDARVPTRNVITISEEDFKKWNAWKRLVFAKMKKAYRNGIFAMAQGTFDGYIDGMVDDVGQPIGRVNYGIAGGETYRFGGKDVETVEDDVIIGYDEAEIGEVIAVFFNPKDYAINSNMKMTVVKWVDHDDNKVKNKAMLICDGKLLDPNGVLIIIKGGAAGDTTTP